MSNTNNAIARRFLDDLAKGHLTDELLTSEFTGWTTGSGAMPGEAFRKGVGLLATIFSSPMQIEIEAITAEGDRVVVEANSQGPLVNGEEYHNTYVFVFRMRDGKVASVAEHNNPIVVQEKLLPLMQAEIAKLGATVK
jgi:uncharacterized protein